MKVIKTFLPYENSEQLIRAAELRFGEELIESTPFRNAYNVADDNLKEIIKGVFIGTICMLFDDMIKQRHMFSIKTEELEEQKH